MWFCLQAKRKIDGCLGLFYSSQKWDTLGAGHIHTVNTKLMLPVYIKHSFLDLGVKYEHFKQFRLGMACNMNEIEMFLFHSDSCYD